VGIEATHLKRDRGLVELTDVAYRPRDGAALRNLTLSLRGGETTLLVGPSECGKSMVLRLVNGLEWPRRGRVRIGKEELTPANAVWLRRRMGSVLHAGGLFPHLTARDNVTLLLRHLGHESDVVRTRVDELLAVIRFPADLLDMYPGQLDGAQRLRVSLMRALVLDPSILLLDDPLGAFAPGPRGDLRGELRELFGVLKRTVVMTSDDVEEARFLADRLVFVRDGRLHEEEDA